jgi:amidase
MFKEYTEYDGLGLAQLIREKHVSAPEVLEAAIQQIEAHNPRLNAVVLKLYDQARAQNGLPDPDSPFAGVPFLLKDLGMDLKGVPTSNGSRLLARFTPSQDAEMVRRYRKTGLRFLGKTNVPEFGIMGVTEPYLWGPCRNPWNLDLTSGGSSGGSSAAVAARMVPLASADDGGGSIRIPASACGVFGFKPSRGVQPMGPAKNESWLSLVSGHVVSRSVRDAARMLDLTQGPGLGAPYGPVRTPLSCWDALKGSVQGRRVAFSKQSLFGQETQAEAVVALETTMKACEALGMTVVESQPKINKEELLMSYYIIIAASVAGDVARNEKLMGVQANLDHVEHATWFLKVAGEKLRANQLEQAIYVARQATIQWEEFLTEFDYFSTPTMAYEPSPVGLMDLSMAEKAAIRLAEFLPLKVILKVLQQIGTRGIERTPNTSLFNMTGHPAMSVPTYWTTADVPIGVQFVGRMGDDHDLMMLAAKLEDVYGWQNRKPSLLC